MQLSGKSAWPKAVSTDMELRERSGLETYELGQYWRYYVALPENLSIQMAIRAIGICDARFACIESEVAAWSAALAGSAMACGPT